MLIPNDDKLKRILKVKVTYTLSPQAKGTSERPYCWLQARVAMICTLGKLSDIERRSRSSLAI